MLSNIERIHGEENRMLEVREALGYRTEMENSVRETVLIEALREMERVFREEWEDVSWMLERATHPTDFRESPHPKLRRYAESERILGTILQ